MPKLLVPELTFQTLDLRDEATERQFMQTLRQMGVPLSDERLMIGVPFDIKEEYHKYNEELKEKTITQQQAKFDTYTALTIKGLPIPSDLRAEVESVLQPNMQAAPMGGDQPPGAGGDAGPSAGPAGQIMMPNPPADIAGDGGLGPGGMGGTPPGGGPPPAAPQAAGPRGTVPEISNERRPGLNYGSVQKTAAELIDVDWIEDGSDLVKNAGISPAYAGQKMLEQLLKEGHSNEEAESLIQTWIEYLFNRNSHPENVNLNDHVEAAKLPETEVEEVPVEEWQLPKGREHRAATDGLPERITKKRSKKDIRFKVAEEKKYSIVDPEAEPLELEINESTESESVRSGADS